MSGRESEWLYMYFEGRLHAVVRRASVVAVTREVHPRDEGPPSVYASFWVNGCCTPFTTDVPELIYAFFAEDPIL